MRAAYLDLAVLVICLAALALDMGLGLGFPSELTLALVGGVTWALRRPGELAKSLKPDMAD